MGLGNGGCVFISHVMQDLENAVGGSADLTLRTVLYYENKEWNLALGKYGTALYGHFCREPG